MEIRLLKFTQDWWTVVARWTWSVMRTRTSSLLSANKSRSSLIDHSINERDMGGRCSFRLDCFCFLGPPSSICLLGKSTPICIERRWEIRSWAKHAGVILKSWAWLYCRRTWLHRSPLANSCPCWKPCSCMCEKQVAGELNGWQWHSKQNALQKRECKEAAFWWVEGPKGDTKLKFNTSRRSCTKNTVTCKLHPQKKTKHSAAWVRFQPVRWVTHDFPTNRNSV